jgi:long-chain acyl-CoA synthetase
VDLGHQHQSQAGQVEEAPRTLTYAQLHARALAVALWLADSGVQPGDRVALLAENSAELAAAFFGIVYAGAAVMPLHVLSATAEIEARLVHAGAKWVLHDTSRSALVQRALAQAPGVQAWSLSDIADAEAPDAAELGARFPVDTRPDAPALLLYTSGTTGRPKGAVISHASLLLHTVLLSQHALGLDRESRVLCVLPLSHSYGCRLALLAPLYCRSRIVIMPRFDAARSLRAMREQGVTWVPAVPTMFTAWGQLTEEPPPSTLRWALSAGAPLADETVRRAERVLGVTVRQGYGMTEATFSTINAPPDQRVLGSVGKPAWGVTLRVVDAQGQDVPTGEPGEVLVRGHNVMSGYLFDADATEQALSDGWVHSGDVGVLDDAGRLRIVDRIKDLIIRGGYNIYPSELENVLGEHETVHSVAVVGRPDAYYGEEVVACVVLRPGAQPDVAALHALASQRLSRLKLPREYVFLPHLPLGASGKVHKLTLREQLTSGQLVPQIVG